MTGQMPEAVYEEYRKVYPRAPRIALPPPQGMSMPFSEVVAKRRSTRKFGTRPLKAGELSALCFSAYGITGQLPGRPMRTVPSAGALYSMELYVTVNSVESIPPGIYHYQGEGHHLELLRGGDFREAAYKPCRQKWAKEAQVVFAIGAVMERIMRKYGSRALRYNHTEAGHISQNIYMGATALGLGTVSIGAYRDSQWDELLGLDPKHEDIVYIQIAGPLP